MHDHCRNAVEKCCRAPELLFPLLLLFQRSFEAAMVDSNLAAKIPVLLQAALKGMQVEKYGDGQGHWSLVALLPFVTRRRTRCHAVLLQVAVDRSPR